MSTTLTETKIDWSTFTRRLTIRAGVKDVYSAWTQPGRIEAWFLEKAEFTDAEGVVRKPADYIAAGDKYKWKFFGYDKVHTGEIYKAVESEVLSFDFGKAGKVEVIFESKAEQVTEMILRQYDIPTDEQSKLEYHCGCSNGWSFWMLNMKVWMEYGIAVNDRRKDSPFPQERVNR